MNNLKMVVPALILRLWFVIISVIAVCILPLTANAQNNCPPETQEGPLFWNGQHLKMLQKLEGIDESGYRFAYRDLIKDADRALKREPYSVTDKSRAGPSGDLRDYVSLSTYWWPNPDTPDELPYVHKDGEANPERNGDEFDRRRSQLMTNDVVTLSLASYIAGDKEYAEHAQTLIQTWFIDEETGMNPNMDFAQNVPGRMDGREFGIIDARIYWDVIDSVLLLENAGYLDADFTQSVRGWFGQYAAWLIKSDFGKKAREKANNHSVFYDAQLAHILIFVGRCDLAKRIIDGVPSRIDDQISKSGMLPQEKVRTRSLHYHAFTIEAFLRLTQLGKKLDVELYNTKKGRSGSIQDAVEFVGSYVTRIEDWPYQNLDGLKASVSMWKMLMHAYIVDPGQNVSDALEKSDHKDPESRLNLISGF